jgi:Bacterial protein of unknown function (DUF882)
MNRRLILLLIAGAVVLPRMAYALPAPQPTRRRLRLVNLHTGETFNGLYRDDRGPLATAMADLSVFLRDFHSGATIGIDVRVIDFFRRRDGCGRCAERKHALRVGAGDGCRIVIVEKAGDRENADLAPDALGGDIAAFLGAHDVAHLHP